MDAKLIELVRKCEELYDMSNKKYIVSVWKEKLWGQIGEELKKSDEFQCFLLHILKLLSFYYHRSSKLKLNSVALVRERTIPTERPPPVGEVSSNFCG